MPRSFHFPNESVDLWQAVPLDAPIEQNRRFTWFIGIGRMKPGVTVDEVRANLDLVQARLARQFPDTDKDLTASVQRLKQVTIGTSGHSLWLLYGSVSLLLLIACANVAALLLSRIADRQREIAIRYSLGASRRSIVAQLLTETLLLGLLGSLAGLGVAALDLRIFHSLIQALPRAPEIGIEWQILLYTLISAFGATLLCGIIPALLASRRTISSTLAAGRGTQVSGNARLQWSLVGMQVALAVTLLIGAGLLIRSFRQLERVSLGFDASNVLTFQVSGNYGETGDQKALHARMMQTLAALSSIPGAQSVALSDTLPGVGGYYPITLTLPDAVVDSGRQITADSKAVSSGYFRTLRIPVLAGQTCHDNVTWNGAVVNRSFARSYLAGQPIVGRHVQMTGVGTLNPPPALIVGMAGNAREDGAEEPPSPAIYWCNANSRPDPYFLIRTHGDPASYTNAVRMKIHQIQPARSVFNLATFEEAIYSSSAETRFRTLLLTLFGVTAIALAAVGQYGTLSYLIGLRQREIGLRMALGALPREIGLHYILRGLRVTLAGAIAGLVVAVAGSKLLSGMLYGVSPIDATTYIAVVAGALVLGGIASCLPARRAARLDPMQVLRYE